MELGIFARTFSRPTIEETLDAVKSAGLSCVQFNFCCAGLPSVPEEIPDEVLLRIARAHRSRGIGMAALSGTTNLVHPDPSERKLGLSRLAGMARACGRLGTRILTLCSGTRNSEDMWRAHPENNGTRAWRDLVESLECLVPVAQEADVVLALEPEQANVVNSASKARRLLDELRSPHLKVLFDAANLLTPVTVIRQRSVLEAAMDDLGEDVVLAHAKDLNERGEACGLGKGLLDWDWYVSQLSRARFAGPFIMHGMSEHETASSLERLCQSAREMPHPPFRAP